MRLLHTSDWHLGRSFHRVDLTPHQEAFLDWLVLEAQSREVDAVLVAGDIFDRAVPPVDAVRLASRALARFAAVGIPVIALAGNHEQRLNQVAGRELGLADEGTKARRAPQAPHAGRRKAQRP